MPGGVPFSEELFATILDGLANGKPLTKVLKAPGMPSYTSVMNWLNDSPALVERYVRAKEEAADVLADEILDLADEDVGTDANGRMDSAAVNRQRLRVDARKWIAAKLKPKKYGDKIQTEHSGEVKTIQVITSVPKSPEAQ